MQGSPRRSWILDSRYWISDSLPVELGVRIPIVSGIRITAASFPVVLGDFGFDVTCQASRENSPIALGSKPPLVNSDSANWPGYEAGITDSKAQDFGLNKKNFPEFREWPTRNIRMDCILVNMPDARLAFSIRF